MGLQRVRHAIWLNKLGYSYTMPLILEVGLVLRAFISGWQNIFNFLRFKEKATDPGAVLLVFPQQRPCALSSIT